MSHAPLIAGRYELGASIGQGAMGEVFLGRDQETGARVAIKRLKPELVGREPTMVDRFAREGETLRRLDHPNIVKLLATSREDGEHYIVLEYVEGGSLADFLRRQGRLPVEKAVSMALELADALARAHHLNIVHRDIKPANVLVAQDGTPRLTDFGVAQVEGSNLTDTGAIVGSCGYISPEALQGRPSGALGDIWSLGVLLYEMLAGRRPFASPKLATEMMAILRERPPDLDSLRPGLPVVLVDLVSRMLAKEPAQRIASMRWVAAELEAMRKGRDSGQDSVFTLDTFTSDGRGLVAIPETRELPFPPTPFVGRDRERREVSALIDDANTRLLAILGPGGIGKTRLALEVAREKLGGFPDGVVFVPLPPESRRDVLVSSIAHAVGCSLAGPDDARPRLLGFLREKTLLLVLDGLEHEVHEAPFLTEILEHAPKVKMLATSRERLRLRAESVFVCEGLTIPSRPEEVRDSDAVRLFVDSCRRARPDFELKDDSLPVIVEICRGLGGMPLAIELAAAWMEMLSPAEVLSELRRSLDLLESDLRDLPERHRSLRAVFESSWARLDEAERGALARLSVFRGGFVREAAEEVSGASLRGLAGLVNKSLLKRNTNGRYEQHELLRKQAEEKREAGLPAGEVRDRHARFYARLAERHAKRLKGREQEAALRGLDEEYENLRAAWHWAVATGSDLATTQLLDGLYGLFEMRGRFVEGEGFLAGTLESLEPGQESLRARLLARRGRFSLKLGRYPEARADLDRALAKLRETGPRCEVAFCLQNLADVASLLGEFEAMTRSARESLAICREIGDRWGMESALNNLGVASYHQGDYAEAERLYRESLGIAREIGDRWGATFAVNNLGVLAHERARYEEAKGLYTESLTLCEQVGDSHGVAAALINLARVHFELRELASAKDAACRGLEMARKLGDGWNTAAALVNLGEIERVMGDPDRARGTLLEAQRRAEEIRATPLALEALLGLGELELSAGDETNARNILARVEKHPVAGVELRTRARALLDGVGSPGQGDKGRQNGKGSTL